MSTTSPIRVDDELYASAKLVGRLMSRSAAQQVAHWARIGRELEASRSISHRAIAAVLDGRRDYDALTDHEQAVVCAEWAERITERRASTSPNSSRATDAPTSNWTRMGTSSGTAQPPLGRSTLERYRSGPARHRRAERCREIHALQRGARTGHPPGIRQCGPHRHATMAGCRDGPRLQRGYARRRGTCAAVQPTPILRDPDRVLARIEDRTTPRSVVCGLSCDPAHRHDPRTIGCRARRRPSCQRRASRSRGKDPRPIRTTPEPSAQGDRLGGRGPHLRQHHSRHSIPAGRELRERPPNRRTGMAILDAGRNPR